MDFDWPFSERVEWGELGGCPSQDIFKPYPEPPPDHTTKPHYKKNNKKIKKKRKKKAPDGRLPV